MMAEPSFSGSQPLHFCQPSERLCEIFQGRSQERFFVPCTRLELADKTSGSGWHTSLKRQRRKQKQQLQPSLRWRFRLVSASS
jgi:hypothetical protein